MNISIQTIGSLTMFKIKIIYSWIKNMLPAFMRLSKFAYNFFISSSSFLYLSLSSAAHAKSFSSLSASSLAWSASCFRESDSFWSCCLVSWIDCCERSLSNSTSRFRILACDRNFSCWSFWRSSWSGLLAKGLCNIISI